MNKIIRTLAVLVTALLLCIGLTAMLAPPANARIIRYVFPRIAYVKVDRVDYAQWLGKGHGYFAEVRDGRGWEMTPCKYEDSRNCLWDARHRGNGIGRSFINIRGRVIYFARGAWNGTAAMPDEGSRSL